MKAALIRSKFILIFTLFSYYGYCQEVTGLVIYVSDGDTFHFKEGEKEKIKVRVADIDCPERTQPYGLEAKEFVVKEIKGKTVKLDILSTDRYGRKIARVIYGDKDLSEELVKEGLAWHYKAYSNDLILADLENKAKQKGEKIWSESNPTPPWDYRKNK